MMINMLVYMTGSHIQYMCMRVPVQRIIGWYLHMKNVYLKYWDQFESVKKEHLDGGQWWKRAKKGGKKGKKPNVVSFLELGNKMVIT